MDAIFYDPQHPYTQALLRSIPQHRAARARTRLEPIKGMVPDPYAIPKGCPFHPRCRKLHAGRVRRRRAVPLIDVGRQDTGSAASCTRKASRGEKG